MTKNFDNEQDAAKHIKANVTWRLTVRRRLEYLRRELRAGRMSYGEQVELQDLARYIEPGDIELLEAAGVPEGAIFSSGDHLCTNCGAIPAGELVVTIGENDYCKDCAARDDYDYDSKHNALRKILIKHGSPEYGDVILNEICELFDYKLTPEEQ